LLGQQLLEQRLLVQQKKDLGLLGQQLLEQR